MDGNRRDSGCCPFFAHFVIRNLSGERRVFTDECLKWPTCPVEGGFSRTFLKNLPTPPLHARDDLHDEKKQGRAAVGKGDEKVRADADGEQD